MPPFQTSEAIRPAKGYPGMMADMAEWNANSGFIEGTTLRPGWPVQRGTGERTFAAFTTGAFAGILRHHITNAPGGVFEEGSMVGAIDEGHMFVRPGGTCTAGGPVYWDATANDGEGGYSDDDTGTLILGAEFHTAAAATDDVVIVNLRKIPGGIPAAETP